MKIHEFIDIGIYRKIEYLDHNPDELIFWSQAATRLFRQLLLGSEYMTLCSKYQSRMVPWWLSTI